MAVVWLLLGGKTGDNAQVLRAARAMKLPCVEKRIVLKPEFETAKPRVAPSLHIIDAAKSDRLEAPWPDLVVTIGRRLSLVALWIKQQSGGKTRIALFNAPKGHARDFDLVVVPAHYGLRDAPNVLRIGLPLIAVDPARVAGAKAQFAAQFAPLRRPLHALLLGGDMGSRRLDADFVAHTLAAMQQGFARDGAVYVSTSRRTPPAAVAAAERCLRPQDRLYRWREGDSGNPLMGLFAHCDSFTVTADSLSMITEVARLNRPLAVAAPPERPGLGARLARLLNIRPARDIDALVRSLISDGHASGPGEPPARTASPPPDDTERVGERLRQIALGRD